MVVVAEATSPPSESAISEISLLQIVAAAITTAAALVQVEVALDRATSVLKPSCASVHFRVRTKKCDFDSATAY